MFAKRMKRTARTATVLAALLVATGAVAGTAVGGTNGWQDIWNNIRPLLSDPGTINDSANPVDWTKLKGVPVGFADGLDHGSEAGFGLTKLNWGAIPVLRVDTGKIQKRVTGTCPSGQAVQSIDGNGGVMCSSGGGGAVYHGWDVASGQWDPIGNDWANVGGGLDVPAGSWSLVATVDILSHVGADLDFVDCQFHAAVDGVSHVLDRTKAALVGPDFSGPGLPLALSGVFSSSKPWRTAVVCRDAYDGTPENDSEASWSDIHITATQASELHEQRLD